jgi:hypothetical protein
VKGESEEKLNKKEKKRKEKKERACSSTKNWNGFEHPNTIQHDTPL